MRLMTEGGHEAVRADDQVVASAEARELKRQIRELERLLGKKKNPARGLGAHEVKKTVVARTLVARGAFPMKPITDTLGVARSNLVEQVRRSPQRRRPYRKTDDAWLLPLMRALVDQRPTYGYRRVSALLLLGSRRSIINACTA
jgi:hypothetical protein